MHVLSYLRALLAGASLRARVAVTVAIAVAGVTLTVTVTGGEPAAPAPQPPAVTVPAPASTPDPSEFDARPDEPGLAPSQSSELPGVAEHVERAIERANARAVEQGTYDTGGVLSGAAAKPARITCLTAMNGGPRSLSDIGLGVAHVTVSPNAPGLLDINALCGFFRRVQASPTWTVDNEGNSSLNVPLERVPWTQAWYNRASCSIEFIGSTGRPGEGAAQWTRAQYREGGRLMAKCVRRAGLPVRRGAVSADGRILRTGLITHQELGAKGGGHTDPGPFFNWGRWTGYVARYTAGRECARIHAFRKRRRAGRPGTADGRAAFKRRHARVRSHALRCLHGRARTS